MTNKERKKQGLIYRYDDPEVQGEQFGYQELLYEYNQTRPTELEKRSKLLKKIFADFGDNSHIETPFHANWGGHNVHIGNNVYCNSNVTFIDDGEIFIGNDTLIAPNVVFATAGHPILPDLRKNNYVYARKIVVGQNVWIGSGVQIMPGVTIGDNSVIGAGSVVTCDIPANVVALGVPCKVVRPINDKDKIFFFKNEKIDI